MLEQVLISGVIICFGLHMLFRREQWAHDLSEAEMRSPWNKPRSYERAYRQCLVVVPVTGIVFLVGGVYGVVRALL